MKKQTATEWLIEQVKSPSWSGLFIWHKEEIFQQAITMDKEQKIEFAEFVATYPDKNKNYLGEMLHAKSKYDGAERTVDLLETFKSE